MKRIKYKTVSKLLIMSMSLLAFITMNNGYAANLEKIKTSCKNNIVTMPQDFETFEIEIVAWIKHCVKSRSKKNGKPVKREIKLVKNNESLSNTWEIVKDMQGDVGITAKYIGKHKVKRIVFSPRGYNSKPISFDGDSISVSVVEKHWNNKKSDIKKGEKVFKQLVNIPKKSIKKIARMPENPVGTPSSKEILTILKEAHPKALAKYTVGALIDVLTANQSKDVSAKRKVLYESYSEGVAKILDPDYRVSTNDKTEVELAFYKLGRKQAKKIKPIKRHQLRMFLIESNRKHAGINSDGSLSYFQSKYYGNIYHKSLMNTFLTSDYRYK